MRVIIVGNGLAGTIAAKTLREQDKQVEVDIFSEEKYHYYPRPNLIEFLAGHLPLEKVFAFPEEWYGKQSINVHLAQPVAKLLPDSKEVETSGGKREKFDFLLLATGSKAFIPPIKGAEKQGVFTLRTLDDAFEIMESIKDHRRVVVIGGGLLGLETARALKTRGAEVEVVEFLDRLLPRQLDVRGAELLKHQIEKMGISIRLGLASEEILGQDKVTGLRFKGGKEIDTDATVVAAGVRADIRLAQEAGLETDKGLIVNDSLQTGVPEILAAGDVIQHAGRVYGIIPASFNQARIAAHNILGHGEKYEGTIPYNTLKVVGIDLTSVGLVNPEDESYEEFRLERAEQGIYKKIVVQDGKIVGLIFLGTKKGVNEISRLISEKKNVEKWKESLLDENFDYSVV
ncbi:MAG: FAD-dependent oxidoreductase [Candidatus Aminicenantes bacterium]|nr:FAD-dependent oxidoreductase [Candidatus Aminicenantes bacterium]MDH5467312.1 FAD-dependent oxidoreductase [Candidatus Aminicenantes bacterium]MDH5705512.1 FAD-dependent oxidoreductase [Candidatus Aminicenantes bacterium]